MDIDGFGPLVSLARLVNKRQHHEYRKVKGSKQPMERAKAAFDARKHISSTDINN